MIYLFNSAFRPEYRTNVLNTLFLPYGSANEYRYTSSGETQNVDPELLDPNTNDKKGEKVCIIYIDRYARDSKGNYKFDFHPIRLGELVSTRVEDNAQKYFNVKLLDYIYPENRSSLQELIAKKIGEQKLPSIVDNDPEKRAQGFFALFDKDNTLSTQKLIRGVDAWGKAVEAVAVTQSFAAPPNDRVIFSRVEFVRRGWREKTVTPKLSRNLSRFNFIRNTEYSIHLTYRFPAQSKYPTATGSIECSLGDELIAQSGLEIPVEGRNNKKDFHFKVKRYAEELTGAINLTFSAESATSGTPAQFVGPKVSLPYRIRESIGFLPLIAMLLVVFSLCGVIIGTDPSRFASSQQPPATQGVAVSTLDQLTALLKLGWFQFKLVAAFIQAVILFLILRIVGKKVV